MVETVRSFVNNYSTTLDGAINSSQTTFDVATGDGAALSTELAAAQSDFIPVTLDDGTNIEIVHVTGVSTDTLTVVRGQEGTTGTAFASGTTVECRPTKDGVRNIPEWVPVSIQTLSGAVANVDFLLNAGEGDYKIVFRSVIGANADLWLTQGTGGGPTFQTANYYHAGQVDNYNTGPSANKGNNAGQIILYPAAGNTAVNKISGWVEISDPTNAATRHNITWALNQVAKFSWGGGHRDNTEAVTALRLSWSTAGNFSADSKFILYRRNH